MPQHKYQLGMYVCDKFAHHDHGFAQLGVFADDSCVHVLAEGWSVVVDICQVDVDGGHVAERWRAAVRSLHGDVVFMGDLVVQRCNHKDVTWRRRWRARKKLREAVELKQGILETASNRFVSKLAIMSDINAADPVV